MAGPALVWFRQDLRLSDNPALHAAAASGGGVVLLYVLADGPGGAALGGAAKWWLHHALEALGGALAARGGRLILRHGDPARIVADLVRQTGAAAVHVNACPEPHWRDADAETEQALQALGVPFLRHFGARLVDPDTPRTRTGGIYGMFTPFANAVRALPPPPSPLPAPTDIADAGAELPSDRLASWHLLPHKPDWAGGLRETWRPGEQHARERARHFLRSAAAQYATGRNLPGQDLTSMLSPHLHWGEISAGALWHALHRKSPGEGERIYASELIWRDFAAYLLWHHAALPDAPLRREFEALPWRDDKEGLAAWQRGRTGVPIVDAGMRQLWQTGWMHNRVRMIAASFLVKHLLIDWRDGAAWFMDTLVDADLASNSTNWQWVAGTGIDSQPFFRVFNPVSQGAKFDADGAYVRRFVPELARLPDKFLHAPWTAPDSVLRAACVTLGETYPRPVVDLAAGRTRALETYRRTVRAGRAPAEADAA